MTQQLDTSLEVYCQFLNSIPDAALVADPTGQIVCSNNSAIHLFGSSEGRLWARNIQEMIPEPAKAAHQELMENYWVNPVARPMDNRTQLEALTKEGIPVPVSVMLNQLDLQDGRYVLAVCRDVSMAQNQQKHLRAALDREHSLAMTDSLTGASNLRHFKELVSNEIERCGRHGRVFSLAYFDIDNFKLLNDSSGHAAGDQLLRRIVEIAKGRLRKTDVIARIGGDEFAVLLPETDTAGLGSPVTDLLVEINQEMDKNEWPVTLSCGVVTYRTPPKSADDAIEAADHLMYQVKAGGKNGEQQTVFE